MSGEYVKLQGLGGSVYRVFVDGELVGEVRPNRKSRPSKMVWAAYHHNPDGYMGPLGGPWDHPTRKAAVEHVVAAR